MEKLQEQNKTDLLLKRNSPHTTRAYLKCIRDFTPHRKFIKQTLPLGNQIRYIGRIPSVIRIPTPI